jgi:hypothetical protein
MEARRGDCPRDAGPRGAVLGALLILLAAGVPAGMLLGHELLLGDLERSLGRALGAEVTIRAVHGSLGPAIVFDGIRVGAPGTRPLLTVERAELALDLGHPTAPRVERIRLLRPSLTATAEACARWSRRIASLPAASDPRRGPPLAAVSPSLSSSFEVTVEDGSVALSLPGPTLPSQRGARQSRIGVSLQGIHLGPAPSSSSSGGGRRRLILGRSVLVLDGRPALDLASAAVELAQAPTARQAGPFSRLALLDGVVTLPALGGAAFAVQVASLSRRPDGYEISVRLVDRRDDPSGGRLAIRGRLGKDLLPATGPRSVEISLTRIDLAPLGALLDRIGLHAAQGRLGGALTLVRSPEGGRRGVYTLAGRLALEGGSFQHTAVSRAPVGPFAASLDGSLAIDLDAQELRLGPSHLALGESALGLSGSLGLASGSRRFSLSIDLPETPCQKVLASLPRRFAPSLVGMRVAGAFSARASLALDTADLDGSRVSLRTEADRCRVLGDPPSADVHALLKELPLTLEGGRRIVLGRPGPSYAPLGKIPLRVQRAFLSAEDTRFYLHRGFDEEQLRRAFIANLKEGRVVRGASTISQQLVKNVFLDQDRSLSRKFQEAVLTWRLEQVVPKDRILELYLNLVEMGPGIYGVPEAARAHFGKEIYQLTSVESARLAAITPNPKLLSKQLLGRKVDPGSKKRVQLLLRLMKRRATSEAADEPETVQAPSAAPSPSSPSSPLGLALPQG